MWEHEFQPKPNQQVQPLKLVLNNLVIFFRTMFPVISLVNALWTTCLVINLVVIVLGTTCLVINLVVIIFRTTFPVITASGGPSFLFCRQIVSTLLIRSSQISQIHPVNLSHDQKLRQFIKSTVTV